MDTYSVVHFDLDKLVEVLVWRGKPSLAKLEIDADTMLSEYSEARVVDPSDKCEIAFKL